MNSWASDKNISTSPVSAVVRGDDPAALTTFCDIYCIKFFDTRLHSIDCQRANGMDPVFPDRKIDDVLPERSLIREWVSGTPYQEEEANEADV